MDGTEAQDEESHGLCRYDKERVYDTERGSVPFIRCLQGILVALTSSLDARLVFVSLQTPVLSLLCLTYGLVAFALVGHPENGPFRQGDACDGLQIPRIHR